MELKSYFLLFCCCAILGFDKIAGYPQSSESAEDDDDDLQQTQQIQSKFNEKEFSDLGPLKVTQITPDPLDRDDPCLERVVTGPCKGYFPRYSLNKATGKCERFTYGGCGGTANNFKSFVECEKRCSRHLKVTGQVSGLAASDHICELPAVEEGATPCSASLPRWTFSLKEGKCVRFMYGGCRGTRNNFENKYACDRSCENYKRSAVTTTTTTGEAGQELTIESLKKASACTLGMEPGPCYGIAKRYFFSRENNRCEKFIYGGCGGNDNNFQTADECLRTCGGDTPSDDEACSLVKCPWNLYSHYQTLGCKPIYDGQACCPTRYDCPDSNITLTKTWVAPTCSYKGKTYAVGESVLEASTGSSCRASCTCYGFGGKPRINCANIECPENLGALPEDKKSCIRLYRKDSCCAYDFYCPNDTSTQEPWTKGQVIPPIVPLEKCNYEGMEYVVGERFYPKNGQCLTCTCLKGFNGSLTDEFCRKIDCGLEIYYSSQLERGCVPVHLQDQDGQDSCCPIGWQCPDEQQISNVIPQSRSISQSQGPPVENRIHTTQFNDDLRKGPNSGLSTSIVVNSTVCALPAITGPCRASRPRFYYNNETRTCDPFTYGGCKGNGNNFVTLADCQTVCQNNTEVINANANDETEFRKSPFSRSGGGGGSGLIQPRSFQLSEEDPCTLPRKPGYCKAYFPRYYFSVEANACKYFVYGGCGGNQNNFMSLESCEATCQNKIPLESQRMIRQFTERNNRSVSLNFNGNNDDGSEDNLQQRTGTPYKPRKVTDITPKDNSDSVESQEEFDAAVVCNLPPITGPCRAHKPRYYYDPSVQYCKRFTYGGCMGNANNFEKLKECDYRCAPNKGQGLPGPSQYPKWRNNNINNNNDNEFEIPAQEVTPSLTIEEQKAEVCKLPMKVGSCKGKIPAVYYDAVTNSCQNFTYGGCFGNANRFGSIDECETTCRIPITAQMGGNSGNGGLNLRTGPGQQPQQPRVGISVMIPGENRDSEGRVIIPNVRTTNEAEKAFCLEDPSPGYCKGSFVRYFWSKESSRCLPFIYTGCRGNRNNFHSESECISSCGAEPTLDQVMTQGVLTCSFGNETLPLGATLGGNVNVNPDQNNVNVNTGSGSGSAVVVDQSEPISEPPCGVPICLCLTPPSLTCIQTACPIPEQNTPEFCPTPNCGRNCKPAVRPDNGCPTCDCEGQGQGQGGRYNEWETTLVKQPEFTVTKGVKS